jgi:hypothetical protein
LSRDVQFVYFEPYYLMTTHLIIPDSHAHPDHHNRRYDWLGELVADIKPDVVINMGDWADMPSLCLYDRGTSGFEGRRYKKDIAAANEGLDRFSRRVRVRKRKLPRFIALVGNHEERIIRAISSDAAQLEGVIGLSDIQFKEHGWDIISYDGSTPGIIEIDGVSYGHYFTTGIMGRPTAGEHPAYTLLTKQYTSCTQGHVHTYDHAIRTRPDGGHIHGMVCGVYQDYIADWAGEANKMWRRGALIKRNVTNGDYDHEWISLDRIKKEYA